MLVKVKNPFIDKYTNYHYEIGETFEATEERIAEINSVDENLIEVVKTKRKKEVKVDEHEV